MFMANNFLKRILEQHRTDRLHQHDDKSSGSFMMQAETAVTNQDCGKADKYVKFYTVPETMRQRVESDSSLLLSSANIHELYGVEKDKYDSNPDKHNKNAEQEFQSYKESQQNIVNNVQKYAAHVHGNYKQR